MLDWIKQGNNYSQYDLSNVPDHPHLSAEQGARFCLTSFPKGVLYVGEYYGRNIHKIGYEPGELLPGLYEYRRPGDNRVEGTRCVIVLNRDGPNRKEIKLLYGEPFTFSFFTYHERIDSFGPGCRGALYRIGD